MNATLPTDSGQGIGAVAARFGVAPDTIRYYERSGVLPSPTRDSAGRRRYSNDAIHLIEVLMHLRGTGMPLATIAEFTALVARDPEGVPERLALLRAHREKVVESIATWTASLAVIDQKIDDYRARRRRSPGIPDRAPGAP